MAKNFYITTPLYYVNDNPHIGHAYTTVVADVLNRYHRMMGENTLFLTGTDEHGQKVQNAALKRGKDPQVHCDELVVNFKNIWKELDIEYDIFYRTTDSEHKAAVQSCLQELYDKGEIEVREYEGWYSESEEIFYTEKDLVDGKSPTGREVTKVSEKNYFFLMSKYQERLIRYIEEHPDFIRPQSRRNEVLGFLKQPLQDLCISRPKSRLTWGIELPFDKDYVTYVWFDALTNYAAAVGFHKSNGESEFRKWWHHDQGGVLHLIGKDILTTHTVYWTTMLFALGAPLPKTIFAHGWWLTENNEKMSKSSGPVVAPLDMKDIVGVDGLRYFLIRDINFGNDAQFSPELVISRVNTELANNLGNLLSRSTNLIDKYFGGKLPATTTVNETTQALADHASKVAGSVRKEIEALSPNLAVGHIVDLLNHANQYLEKEAPWKSAKDDVNKAAESLAASVECLRIAGILLTPVIPQKATELLRRIGYQKERPTLDDAGRWSPLPEGTQISKGDPLFPRVESKEKA